MPRTGCCRHRARIEATVSSIFKYTAAVKTGGSQSGALGSLPAGKAKAAAGLTGFGIRPGNLCRGLGADAAHFFSQTLASQGLLDAFLFSRLEEERVFLDILDDVFLLHLSFEAAKRAFKRLAIIQDNFRQS
jgi:hypothetical protein